VSHRHPFPISKNKNLMMKSILTFFQFLSFMLLGYYFKNLCITQ
jgi:hypothetical protein